MSGNIKDTEIGTVRQEVFDLITEIKRLKESGEDLTEWTSTLQNRHKYLYKTSKTLFDYIVNNYLKESFDDVFFNQTLNMMLSQIAKIQNKNISQEDASASVGTHLAEAYVPQLKKK